VVHNPQVFIEVLKYPVAHELTAIITNDEVEQEAAFD
jgi:hypothetical protein